MLNDSVISVWRDAGPDAGGTRRLECLAAFGRVDRAAGNGAGGVAFARAGRPGAMDRFAGNFGNGVLASSKNFSAKKGREAALRIAAAHRKGLS